MNEVALFDRALREPIGIAVPTNNPEALRRRLYRYHSQYPTITLTVSPIEKSEIWLIHKEHYS